MPAAFLPDTARFHAKRLAVHHLFGLRRWLWPVLDLGDWVRRAARGHLRYPPISARQKVSGSFFSSIADFDAIGRDCLDLLRTYAGLQPGHSVLDLGCGCGRVALPLLAYLDPATPYWGGDIDAAMIRWCRRRIAPRHPNATFFAIDVHNGFYNPGPLKCASDYRFPLEDGRIDRAFLGGVFTHMLPVDVMAYLRELARVLAPGGCVLASFFLVDAARLGGPARRRVEAKFPFARQGYRIASEKLPELEVAHETAIVHAMLASCGLRADTVLPGSWTGQPGVSGQDFLVIRRAG